MQNFEQTNTLILAETGKRFLNNLIDTICFYFLIFLSAMLFDEVLGIVPEEGADWFVLYFILLYVVFHALFEYFFGKTPGKFLTKTKVVKRDGTRPTFWNILGRNTARLIPFDPISYLFSTRGWHDQVSNTYVVMDHSKI
ncbi:RDD family protein [Aequorivita echinoideorum]|uniref:RDD family protein n=1 Tax=Aequorivita echinoideorum TaxID=1549647 RepID=A0ABS5S9T3_9FLAO|nr:RDD family protein [Aequorivita echinoideorum]MBT0609179.1 RDD family protein [Aequorivita echinoideorum]